MIMLIFEDGEKAVIQNILSMVGTKARVYETGFQDRCTLAFHGLVIDELQHVVLREGRRVELTSIEFEILDLLARHPGVVFGREQIYSAVWKESGAGDCQIVMNHIHNIREKIEDDPAQPAYIQTVWGVGYRFCGENISDCLKHG